MGKQSHALEYGEQVHYGFQQIDWYESNKQMDALLNTLPHALAKKGFLNASAKNQSKIYFQEKVTGLNYGKKNPLATQKTAF